MVKSVKVYGKTYELDDKDAVFAEILLELNKILLILAERDNKNG